MWNELCGCIDENWKALKARIQASITGIKLNGTTYYQTDGTGICDLGEIQTEIPKASEIELDDGRDVQTAIVSIDEALPDKVIDVEPSAVTGGINLNETDGNGTVARTLIRADDSLAFDGLQIGISDKTDGRITEAMNTATTAGNKADDAQTDADSAMSAATTAKATADTALTKAETAITNAATAQATATTAQGTAETALSDASTAQTTADTAIEKADNALSTATTANDTANTAKDTANTANATATNAQATASTAKSTADTAKSTADTAQTTANTAKTTADEAKETAETAQTTAESAQSTANTASSTASTAYQTAVTAKTTAETADGVADEAKTTADTALTKAKNAIVSFVTSVTDKILNATVTKGDDTTETVELFTAGNNLSWNGKTLNAVGGAAYAAGDGITLADGAFSVNVGTGLQINATDKSLEVNSDTTDALDTRVTNLETTASGLQTSVSALDTSVQTLDGEVDTLNTTVAGKQATVTGGASTITTSNLTTNRALISNSSGKVAVSAVTSTELGYLDGVTSNVQTQLNAKIIGENSVTGSVANSPTSMGTASYGYYALKSSSNSAAIILGAKNCPYGNTTVQSSTPRGNCLALPTGVQFAYGSFYGYTSATRYVPATITLPVAYSSASSYVVVATIEDHDVHNLWGYTVRVRRISGSQFMVYVQNAGGSGGSITDDCKINWIAIGY